jgi:hypothetical protein
MSNLFFSVCDRLTIKISSKSDLNFSESELFLLKAYVPNINRLASEPKKIDFTINHTESEEVRIIKKENSIHIFAVWDGKLPPDLYHLLYAAMRNKFLGHKLFSVHGACVGKNSYILLVGHSGDGKTSVALKLLNDEKIKIYSGNKTVISLGGQDKIMAFAGTPTITIRGEDKERLKDLNIANYIEYWGRYAFMLTAEKYTEIKKVPIKAIVMLKLNDNIQEFKKLDILSGLHILYPFFLDVVNSDVIIGNTDSVFVGTRPAGIENYLVANLKKFLKNTPVFFAAGSSYFIADKILRI